jgi:porin
MRLPIAIGAVAALLTLAAPHRAVAEDPPGCPEGITLAPGLCLSTEATLDAIANLRGGVRRGVAATGQVWSDLDADFERLAGIEGWRGRLSVIAIYGRQPTATLTGGLAPASNIEALSTVRLFEIWLERDLGDWGSLRFGQLAADTEFATLQGGRTLVSGTFGWPVALATTLPAGGPAYPLATPGIRLALGDPEAGNGARLAIYSGNPGGRFGIDTDPQRHNRFGTTFSTSGGAFMIAEGVVGAEAPERDAPRPWVLKLGGWYHNASFDSPRTDNTGLPLADPASSGMPRRYGSNHGGYLVGEAVLWRQDAQSLAVFGRAFAQPQDRNAIAWQVDGGVVWRGPFGRAADTAVAGLSWAQVGSAARGYDRDVDAFGTPRPVRSHETMLEVNYDAAIMPDRLFLRPLVQVLLNPAARQPDERRSTTGALPDSILIGMRVVARF